MGEGRSLHTATLMRDGTVLVAGGYRLGAGYLASVERYDPATGGWTAAPRLSRALSLQGAALLADGGVLVVGTDRSDGTEATLAEVYRD